MSSHAEHSLIWELIKNKKLVELLPFKKVRCSEMSLLVCVPRFPSFPRNTRVPVVGSNLKEDRRVLNNVLK